MKQKYFDELKRTMEWLGMQPDTMFIGQTVAGPGTFMYKTLLDVPIEKRLEMPINESFQMQFCTGVALSEKHIPICIYPRQNFLLIATADMTNMLDKIPAISENQKKPNMIIRVASGPYKPVHPGHQHIGNYAEAFRNLFTTIKVVEVNEPTDIFPAYEKAYNGGGVSLIIEEGNFYQEK